jgi:hypothetical protein
MNFSNTGQINGQKLSVSFKLTVVAATKKQGEKYKMSKGKLKKTGNNGRSENQLERSTYDIVDKVIPQYEVDVTNDDWQNADKDLKEELSKVDNHLKDKISSIVSSLIDNKNEFSVKIDNIKSEIESIKSEIERIRVRKPIEVKVNINNKETIDLGTQHCQFPELLRILSTKLNVYLVGPAGSGKTTAAIKCAEALDIPFHFTGAIASEFKLTGFINAQGETVRTEFREAYENGGLFLFDEIDASYPQAVLAFNAALANDYMDFPDKKVERHENFYCIAAANTFGQGADRQYIGRNQLDAASLDRFVFIDWKFDEKLERELAANDEWVDFVQDIRKVIVTLKIRHVVSPRASFFGAKLLAAGLSRKLVAKSVIWKGLDISTINTIIKNLENYEYEPVENND